MVDDVPGPPFFEDVVIGDVGPSRHHLLTRTDFVRYAGASGDFNPMHHDDPKAVEAGMPSVFGHGMLSAGILAGAVTDLVGLGTLRRFDVRFTKQAWPGKTVSTEVTIIAKRTEGATGAVDLRCTLVDDTGSVIVEGEATAVLPSRAQQA